MNHRNIGNGTQSPPFYLEVVNKYGFLTVSEISFMMTSQMVAAIWIGMRIFPLVQPLLSALCLSPAVPSQPVLSGGERQYAESHRGIFRLLYSNGIGDTKAPQGLDSKGNLSLLLQNFNHKMNWTRISV